MSSTLASIREHGKETSSIIRCHKFLVEMGILQVTPCKVFAGTSCEICPDGKARFVEVVEAMPKMDVTLYPGMEELMVDLMASVSYFYAEQDVTKKLRICANMLIAVLRHAGLAPPGSSGYYEELTDWVHDLTSFDELSSSEPALTRCIAKTALLRGLGNMLDAPLLTVRTPVYDPIEQRLGITPASPIFNVENIHPTSRRGSAARKSRKKSPSPNLSGWYTSQNLKSQDSFGAITALVRRYCALRDAGVWELTPPVKNPIPARYAVLQDKGGSMQVFGRPKGSWRMEMAEYYSAQAFFVDIMRNVCALLASPGEYEKRCTLAVMLDCLIRHWPVDDPELAGLWEEMASWLWKFSDMACVDLDDRNQSVPYLECCDKYLEEFQQRFVSRTSVRGPLNVWGDFYMPRGTAWRQWIIVALYNPWGSEKKTLLQDPLPTDHFACPLPESTPEQALVNPSSSKGQDEKMDSDVAAVSTAGNSGGSSAIPSSAGGFSKNVVTSTRPDETNPMPLVQEGKSRAKQPKTYEAGQHDDEKLRVHPQKKKGERNAKKKRSKRNALEISTAPPVERSPEEGRDSPHGNSGREKKADPRQKRRLSDELQNLSGPSEVETGGRRDEKRQVDDNLGCDYLERMRSVQVLVKHYRNHFPDQSDHFRLFNAYARKLRKLEAPEQVTEVVMEMLNEKCIENIKHLFESSIKKLSALVDPSVKEEMETCLDALSSVLNDSRVLVNLQARSKKKRRRQ